MSDSPQYFLRWRGRTSGPLSLDEILHKLDEHEIGLYHELGQEDRWTTLGEFLEKRQRDSDAQSQVDNARQYRTSHPPSEASLGSSIAVLRPHGLSPTKVTQTEPGLTQTNDATLGNNRLATASPRSRKLFIALGLLFGFTGAHNFYAGYWGTALIQIILSSVTWVLGFGIIISWLWALIELLVVYADARGRPMN